MAARTAPDPNSVAGGMTEFGASGLRQFSGYVREEWLRDLQGWRGIRMIREMRDNDPIIGAVFFAIEMLLRGVSFRIEPADKTNADDVEAAAFVNSCMSDMEQSWPEFMAQALTFLQYGWSVHEIVYKFRRGKTKDPKTNSAYDDGMIGWRKFAGRAQETLMKWEFDEAGDATHMVQLLPTGGPLLSVPLSKCLHFVTVPLKNSPEGRALDPETPIPTRDGWRRMDDIQPGDTVFDEAGKIRYVTARADWEDRPCYRVVFGDGSEIIADANHQWVVRHARRPMEQATVTTEDMAGSQLLTTADGSLFSIERSAALDYPTQNLPIDPYVLGVWLGDGCARSSEITCHNDDFLELSERVQEAGFGVEPKPYTHARSYKKFVPTGSNGAHSRDGLRGQLRAAGLLENKHVPAAYLRGDVKQRTALLQGLMDSDGHVSKDGHCLFSNTNAGLTLAVAEIVRSLGVSARVNTITPEQASTWSVGEKTIRSKNIVWTVNFKPHMPVFRLARKVERQKEIALRRRHYIRAIEPVEPRRTVCIEVDGPSHMFLAGESMVPTHNSILRNAYVPYYRKKRIEEIEAIGIERDLAGLPIAWVPPEILKANASPENKATYEALKKMVRDTARNEQEGFVFPLAYSKEGNKLFDFTLLSTGGRRQFDTVAIIDRYDHRIAASMLADFIVLGAGSQQGRGSFAQAQSKTGMFGDAVTSFLDLICAVFNMKGIPDLLELNSLPGKVKMAHGDVTPSDITALGDYVSKLVAAAVLTADDALEAHMREEGGLPDAENIGSRSLNEGGEASEASDHDPAETASDNPADAQGRGDDGDAA